MIMLLMMNKKQIKNKNGGKPLFYLLPQCGRFE